MSQSCKATLKHLLKEISYQNCLYILKYPSKRDRIFYKELADVKGKTSTLKCLSSWQNLENFTNFSK